MAGHEATVTPDPPVPPPDAPGASTGVDVFISYARANRSIAEQLAAALAAQSFAVWWDRDLHGGSEFAEAIEAQLLNARVVLVLWSTESVRSGFVRDESARALRTGKLLPVRIDEVDLPLGFGQIHTLDLLGWDGDTDAAAFVQLVRELRRLQGKAAPAETAAPHLTRRASRRLGLVAGGLVLVVVLGWGGKTAWEAETARREAQQQFQIGLDRQDAKEPQLESAFEAVLTAVQLNPRHARAHYFLAHRYAQDKKQPADALEHFQISLTAAESPLDRLQRTIAQDNVREIGRTLTASAQESPVTRLASADPGLVAVSPPAPRAPQGSRMPGDAMVAADGTPLGVGGTPRAVPLDSHAPAFARLAGLVDTMFDANNEKRISATTSLVVDADALSDAVPLAVTRALGALRDAAASPDASVASGVVNTLVLLQSALPSTLALHRAAIEELIGMASRIGETTRRHAARVSALLQEAPARRPVAYFQIANEAQRPIAEQLRANFRNVGYSAPGIELVAKAPDRTEVRIQGRSDRGLARWMARAAAGPTGEIARLVTLRSANPKTDTFEIWLDRNLCAPGGRQAPGCAS